MISAIWWYPYYRESSKRKRDNTSEKFKTTKSGGASRRMESEAKGFVTIKDGHGGCVIWMCAAGQRKGQHHGHVWVCTGGQSHRI